MDKINNWYVVYPGEWKEGWFGVGENKLGVIAYFLKEDDALDFRTKKLFNL